ncbi:MAG: ATP-binding cassette domain-containing protein [Campylobacteraceae bacterium]|nr:ATP-binding cassette domain-containing protein [Campylobacteraceae bacterium]
MAFFLENENISYSKANILSGVNLKINKGEKVALLGKSGSGKSTLLKHLFSLQKNNASYIPQELSLVNNLSVFHNIFISKLDTYSSFYNLRNLFFPIKKEVDEIKLLLKDLSLEDKLFIKVSELSGGQKQRVSILRAKFNKKCILLADEPISALDEYLAQKVLKDFVKDYETVICTLHNVSYAINTFDRVIGLKNGKILIDKACKDLTQEDRKILYYAVE